MANREAQRRTRAALTAGALLLLTLTGHTAGGGSVDLLGLTIVTALSAGLAISTTARPLRVPRLLAVLIAGQVLLHLVLTFTAGHAAHGAPALPFGVMIVGHGVAALFAALVVRHADGLVSRWIAFVSAALGARPGAVVTAHRAASPVLAAVDRPLVEKDALLHHVVRRGPPAGMHLIPA